MMVAAIKSPPLHHVGSPDQVVERHVEVVRQGNEDRHRRLSFPEGEVSNIQEDLEYLEQRFKQLVTELKRNGCIHQEIQFLTSQERLAKIEEFMDAFIKKEDPLDHQ